jgi:hypothetical protein
VLIAGKVVEEGRRAKLLAAGNQYAWLYNLQFREEAEAAGRDTVGVTAACGRGKGAHAPPLGEPEPAAGLPLDRAW